MLSLLAMLAATAGPSPQLQASIKSHFDAKLFDGMSARYIWPEVRGKPGAYCGWVNAKNRLGAYTGFKPFMVMHEGARVTDGIMTTDDDFDKYLIQTVCGNQGYDVTQPPRAGR